MPSYVVFFIVVLVLPSGGYGTTYHCLAVGTLFCPKIRILCNKMKNYFLCLCLLTNFVHVPNFFFSQALAMG